MLHLAFLDYLETPRKDGYLGAVLVTDATGLPVEFRCTHPVKPTAIQRSLYGAALATHISVHLCAVPLLDALQTPLDAILVRRPQLLAVRGEEGCVSPVAFIRPANPALAGEDPTQLVRGSLATFTVQDGFPGDQDAIAAVLGQIRRDIDLQEPCGRIERAIAGLSKEDATFA